MDLMAECPWRTKHRYWYVECKGIYEHKDNRCGADRFQSKREILKDFDHALKACAADGEDRWAVVWVAFSPENGPQANGPGAKYFRLPDLIREVRGSRPVEPRGLAVLDLEPLTAHAGLRYCHVIVWADR
jgi:hypothetical protein